MRILLTKLLVRSRTWVLFLFVGSLSCTDKPKTASTQPAVNSTQLSVTDPGATARYNAQTPDAIVQALYKAADRGESPFLMDDSATVALYFSRELTELIWEDIQTMRKTGEIGMLEMDPLYNAQDTDIRNFRVATPTYLEPNQTAEVKVTFTNFGKAETLCYQLVNERAGWRIGDIVYQDGSQLIQMMSGKAENTP